MIERLRVSSLAGPLSYQRVGEGAPIALDGTPDDPDADIDVVGAVGAVKRERDFLFARSDLAVGGTPFEPAKGDVITQTIDEQAVEWVVGARDALPAWETEGITNERVRVRCTRRTAGT